MELDLIKELAKIQVASSSSWDIPKERVYMTKGDVVRLFNCLNQLIGLRGAKFSYAVAKNLGILKAEVEALTKVLEQTPEFKEFEQKRVALAEKHAKKDEKGKPVSVNNNYQIEDVPAFEKEYNELKEANKEVVDKYQEQVTAYNELLKEPITIELHKVKIDDVPNEITTIQMNGIVEIIAE